ncbi:toxin glutamine deamidase domain-containing protein [Streptomyces platensis]|uniref:toxin glutamine deamidase domain-containing protein n=1 Tax=Streptomyces platensis TaxID=58346 RepID=UPI003870339B|nr:toxin glutamine deamidase domain-containing protein [Streptomyces platensis]
MPRNEDGTPQRFANPFDSWAQLQNDGGNTVPGRSNNCADCSRSFLETWFGNPQVSAPRTPDTDKDGKPDTWSPERAANENQIRWSGAKHSYAGEGKDPNTAARIANDLLKAGHGSAAIVQVNWPKPQGGGHAFNAVNYHGKIVWIDTQTGQVSHDPIHISKATHAFYIPLDANRQPLHADKAVAQPDNAQTQTKPDSTPADQSQNKPDTTPTEQTQSAPDTSPTPQKDTTEGSPTPPHTDTPTDDTGDPTNSTSDSTPDSPPRDHPSDQAPSVDSESDSTPPADHPDSTNQDDQAHPKPEHTPSDQHQPLAPPSDRESTPRHRGADASQHLANALRHDPNPLMYGRPVPHAPDQTSNHSATPEPHQQHPTSESTANNPPRTTEAHSAAPTTAQPGGHPVPADPAGAETDDSDNDREIRRKQLEKANTDPAWFKKYYQKNGHRIRKDRRDENNNRVPQLHPTGDPKTPWMLASDAPEAEGESYIDTGEKKGKRKVGISKENLEILDKSAKKRQNAIDADDLPHKARQQAKENYEKNKTAENKAEFDRADAIHSPLHGKMTRASEDYGEDVAEYHAVPEHFKDAVRVDDRGTGNNRFDQVWKLPNGEFIVVEAKGSPRASLGDRRGLPAGARDIDHEQPGEGAQQHNGTGQDSQEDSDNSTSPAVRRVKQGTREYFKVILHEMKTRSNENLLKATTDAERAHALAERKLANELTDALLADPSRITYLLVKGVPDGEKHGGYEMYQFDIRTEKEKEQQNDQNSSA